jgi:hypothetical protein
MVSGIRDLRNDWQNAENSFPQLTHEAKYATLLSAVHSAAEISAAVADHCVIRREGGLEERKFATCESAAIAVVQNGGTQTEAGYMAAVALRNMPDADVSRQEQADAAAKIVIKMGGGPEERQQ